MASIESFLELWELWTLLFKSSNPSSLNTDLRGFEVELGIEGLRSDSRKRSDVFEELKFGLPGRPRSWLWTLVERVSCSNDIVLSC